jgi:3-deoxy-D-manno-octulosonate 8-phosphate phosphatase (KDO 8-P phosphatase)
MSESQSNSKRWCGTIPSEQVIERAKQIQLLLMDVDGVLTDGKVYHLHVPAGQTYETKGFDSHDGLGFYFLKDAGIVSGFISGRKSQAVDQRAENMQVKYVRQGNLQKEKDYEDILRLASLSDNQVAYIGDDFTDVPLFKRVGLACAVANARNEVKPYAHFISQAEGGKGAVREIIELILKAQNKWPAILAKYGIDQTLF